MTLVFVHGFLGGSQQWNAQVDALREFDVITVDLPGFGANADQEPLYAIEDYAEWVLVELADRGIEQFHLLGHSMGGMIAQEMVARAPQRVDRLILYGTGSTGQLPGRFETIDVSKDRARTEGPRATARRIAATWFLHQSEAKEYEACAAIAEQSGLHAILAGLDAMCRWNGAANLDRIETRTLLIWGDRDRTYPWAQTELLWHNIKHASLAVIPDCSHAVHMEQPALFNAMVRDFVTH